MFATLNGLLARLPFAVGGSGSSYVYGFVDAEYRRGMSRQEAQQLVLNSGFVVTHARERARLAALLTGVTLPSPQLWLWP